MKKIIIIIGIMAFVGLITTIIWTWNHGKIFFYAPAEIKINGVKTYGSSIYKSGYGNYFVFLEKDVANHTTYWVASNGEFGLPTDNVPSMATLSFRTQFFLVCLDFEIERAGTEWFAPNAKSNISPGEINFQVNEDVVNITF